MSAKKITQYGMFVALAFIFSYVEAIFPLQFPVPGMKLGLANLVVVTALYLMGSKPAFFLSIIRIILVGFTFGNPFSMVYGMAGGVLSFLAMLIFRKTHWFGITGVSIIGGIFHNLGQLVVAMIVVENFALIYYFPALLIAGMVTGALIGIVANLMIERLNHYDLL